MTDVNDGCHSLAINFLSGLSTVTEEDVQRLAEDLQAICESHRRRLEKPSLAADPRYERVKELVTQNPPPFGASHIVPRRIWRDAGFTDEEINERHSLGRNLR